MFTFERHMVPWQPLVLDLAPERDKHTADMGLENGVHTSIEPSRTEISRSLGANLHVHRKFVVPNCTSSMVQTSFPKLQALGDRPA